MANINTLAEAVEFLETSLVKNLNDIDFKNPETNQIAEIIIESFSDLKNEVCGYPGND